MKRFLSVFPITFLLLFSVEGACSDSTYIAVRWNGSVDKPYYEFVFYKDAGYNPDQDSRPSPWGGNPFVLQLALSDKQFMELKHILFAEYNSPDSSKRSDPLFMSYYIGYFEGSKWLLTNYMNKDGEFVKTSIDMITFFKGTKYEADVKYQWKMIFDRLGIKSN